MSQIFIWDAMLNRGPLLPVQNNYERFFNSTPQDVANELGLTCFTGKPNILLVDYDTVASHVSISNLRSYINLLSINGSVISEDFLITRSKNNKLHAYVKLVRDLTFTQYLKALGNCGSDMMRNDILKKKAKMYPDSDPFNHVALFEAAYEAKRVEEFLGTSNREVILW